MIRTYTMRLKVTRKQDETLHRLLAQLCELYNMALQQRRDVWKSHGKCLGLYEQQRQLTELRNGIEEYGWAPLKIQRDPLKRLERVFKAFSRKRKIREKVGYPRFKNTYKSFAVDKENFGLSDGVLRIVKLGHFRIRTRFKIHGDLLQLRVKRCGQKWQAQVVCDIGPAPQKVAVRNAIGIDLGLTSLITLSDGTEVPNPRWFKQEEEKLAEANRALETKKRGSNNRRKAREHLRQVYEHTAGLRKSYLHKVSNRLLDTYDLVAFEDLKVKEMVHSSFAKSILDAAWAQLIWQLKYKAESAGKWAVPVNPRNTTQICSGCGELVPKGIRQRRHDCPKCGASLGRDHNAALNILALGKSAAIEAKCAGILTA